MKTAVVTGGTNGLGREISLALAALGFTVVAPYRQNDGAAASFADDLRARGHAGRALRHDVTDEARAAELATLPEVAAATTLVLVNNAWTSFALKPLHLLEWSDFASGFDGGLRGAFLTTRALLRPLVRTRGTVVNVLTRATIDDVPKGFGAYAAAKAALRSLTRSLATEYGPQGLRAFSVSPGYMNTDLTAGWDAGLRERLALGATSVAANGSAIARLAVDPAVAALGEDHPLA